MKILLVEDDLDIRELLHFAFESQVDAEYFLAANGEEAIKIIEKEKLDLIICDYNMPKLNGGHVYAYLLSHNINTPYVMCSSDYPDDHGEFKDKKNLLFHLVKPNFFEQIPSVLEKLKTWKTEDGTSIKIIPLETNYVPINIRLLKNITELPVDLYIQVGDSKAIKVHKKGDEFTSVEHQKYIDKKIQTLLVDVSEANIVGQLIQKRITSILNAQDKKAEDKILNMQEVLSYSINAFGINPEISAAAKASMEYAYDLTKSNKNISSLLANILNHKDSYLSAHCSLLCLVSAALAQKMSWQSEIALKKLTLASMMHDISLSDFESLEYQIIEKFKNDRKKNEFILFSKHMLDSANLVNQLKEVPPDVDKIILEHHERPDGTGFNRGLTGNQISALGAVFILAHDIVDELWKAKLNNQKLTLVELAEKLPEENYPGSNFRKVYQAFTEMELFKNG